MKKKKKVNKKKLLSRIFLLFVIAIIIILINVLGSKNKEQISSAKVIIDGEDMTNSLQGEPYIDKDGTLYMSLDDIQKIFDKNIYYEEETGKIITTSRD